MSETPLLQLRGITKTFGSVEALTDVDFEVRHGEVMALVGDNGAGKSTLVKCIAGTHAPDSGDIVFEGKSVHVHGPKDAARLGIEVVYQDLALCDNLDVAQTRQVLDLVKRLGEQGLGVVLISHNLHDVFEVATRITVLRLGRDVGVYEREKTTQQEIVEAITAGVPTKVSGIPATAAGAQA